MALVGINVNQIEQCISDSFIGTISQKQNYKKILKNAILDEEYIIRKNNFITRIPSLTINADYMMVLGKLNMFLKHCVHR